MSPLAWNLLRSNIVELSSARELKVAILEDLFGYSRLALPASVASNGEPFLRPPDLDTKNAVAAESGALDDVTDPRRLIALGISPRPVGGRDDEHRLVVLCQREQDLTGSFVTAIRDRSPEDIDLRYIGSAARLGQPAPGDEAAAAISAHRPGGPLRMGDSIAHFDVTAGTLGCFVEIENEIFVLSNNHVLANANQASTDDDVLWPSPIDNGRAPTDVIGPLAHWVPLDLNPGGLNVLDCAIAKLNDPTNIDRINLYNLPGQAAKQPISGRAVSPLEQKRVYMVGRTSGPREGRIFSISTEVEIAYLVRSLPRRVVFQKQITIEGLDGSPFARSGDSGAVVFDESWNAVGLVFAVSTDGGAQGGGLTFANHITAVLDVFDAKL